MSCSSLFKSIWRPRALVLLSWVLLLTAPFVLTYLPELSTLLSYDRVRVTNGELWRLLTANLTHVSLNHAALNCLVMVMLLALFGAYSRVTAFFAFLAMCLAVFVLEHVLGSNDWAKGMSGAVYGFAIFGSLTYLNRLGAALVLGALMFKMNAVGFSLVPESTTLIGAPVLVSHHAYGIAAGLLLLAFLAGFSRVTRANLTAPLAQVKPT